MRGESLGTIDGPMRGSRERRGDRRRAGGRPAAPWRTRPTSPTSPGSSRPGRSRRGPRSEPAPQKLKKPFGTSKCMRHLSYWVLPERRMRKMWAGGAGPGDRAASVERRRLVGGTSQRFGRPPRSVRDMRTERSCGAGERFAGLLPTSEALLYRESIPPRTDH